MSDFSNLEIGSELPVIQKQFTRSQLVAYALASGDMNPIHQDEGIAKSVGLPDVIAHGMLTMGCAIQVVTDWIGDPTAVLDYSVRMTRPVVVPAGEVGVPVTFSGKIGAINGDGTIGVDLSAVFADQTALGQAKAVVRLPQ